MLAERTPCNIVAAVDAQITDVRVYCGQLEHLLGDGVKAGEILVSGVHTDENGHTSYRHALADITGIYTKETELTEYFTYSVTEPTGRYRICRYFCLFGIQVPLTPVQSVFTEASETESYTPFSFLSATLPCGIFQKNYTETVTSVTIRSEDETRLALNASIVRYEKNLLSDVEILDRQAIYTTEENGITCRITYTLKGEIGKVSDFYID
jgi:similar to stage IV sporulation protein